MRRRIIGKYMFFLILCIFFSAMFFTNTYANDIDDYDFSEINEQMQEYDIDFKTMAKLVIEGKINEAFVKICKSIAANIFFDFSYQKELIIKIILIGLAGAVFCSLTKSFSSLQVSVTGSFVAKLVLFTIITSGYIYSLAIVNEQLENIIDFMQVLIPTYTCAIAFGNGSFTALAFYEVVMFVIFLVDKLIMKLIIPAINVYMIINLMNYLTDDNLFSKFTELIKEIIGWMNKSLIGIVIGLNVIKGLINPILDSLKGTAINKAISLIPGAGNVINAVTSVVIGSGILIKNTIGVTAMIILFIFCIIPVIKLFVFAYGCMAACALLEPIADKTYIGCINGMHESVKMMMVCLINVLVLFLLTIALVCFSQAKF